MSGKGSNSVKLRHYNERFVLDAIRRLREASKSELARAASLTPAAVAAIVDRLEAAGFVKQVGKRFGQRGTPSILYRLNPKRLNSIGIKIGRRALQAVMIDLEGEVQGWEEHEYDFPDPTVVLKVGNAALATLMHQADRSMETEIAGLGIGAPYFLGGWSEELGFPGDLDTRWTRVDLAAFFEVDKKLPVFVENDASAAALAELNLGVGSGFKDFMHISIDTFVGGGLVQNGQLHTGAHGNSAALGPLPVSASNLNSVAGQHTRFRSLLHRASIYVLVNHLRAHGVEINRVRELEPLASLAREPLVEWMDDCAGALAEAIIAITSIIDLEAIILDSILPRTIHLDLLSRVQREFTRAGAVGIVPPEIISGQFGATASPVGAATLPISALIAPDSDTLMLGKHKRGLGNSLSVL
ncbi:ROK family protein [Shinella kummerowiae]|uniref:ROK family protein n=1 Tax=Shinella kummerowiae TaxID=417745 RepID=A0A6N8SJI8_9HYPH|nr:ROK family protein [Shinella kummerowiae]